MIEDRRSIESLIAAFEALADRAGAQGWPVRLIAEANFQCGVSLMLAHIGLDATASQCAHLARELQRLAELLDARDAGMSA
jgi:hypothetical protein